MTHTADTNGCFCTIDDDGSFVTCEKHRKASALYDELVDAIVKAVPERTYKCPECGQHEATVLRKCRRPSCNTRTFSRSYYARSITLEDVLMALPIHRKPENRTEIGLSGNAVIFSYRIYPGPGPGFQRFTAKWVLGYDLAWHLRFAPETIRFLHSLLVP